MSLREAVDAANNLPGPHTINFDETIDGSGIFLKQPLVIPKDMTIDGAEDGISLNRDEMLGAFRLIQTGLSTNVTILGLEF